MKSLIKNAACYSLLLVAISACKTSDFLVDDFDLALPEQYDNAIKDTIASVAMLRYDTYFDDENLNYLIEKALIQNQDNQIAIQRIRMANANLRMARGNLLPEINGIAGASQRRFGDFTMDGVGNADSNLSPTVPENKMIPDPYLDFYVGANFNWELDIWGKYRNQKKAAAARYLASEEMSRLVGTSLIANIAETYYQIVGLDEELRILEENIEIQQLAFNLSKDLKESGKENQLAVDQFEALTLRSQALSVEKEQQLQSANYRLAVLIGDYEFDFDRIDLDQAVVSPRILQLGLPADLLQYRPDIRQAERELFASKVDVLSARAAFFPSLNLFGSVGYNAFDFSRLLLNPASVFYQMGAGLVAPIFNRNQIKANYERINASQQVALLEYEKTVLGGYVEVLDVTNQIQKLEIQRKLKQKEVSVQKRSIENSNIMFSVGYANYIEVLYAQNRALEAEIELVNLKTRHLTATVQLYRALGGGWQ